jgi:nucleoside-diphosphate-sugar epimerase
VCEFPPRSRDPGREPPHMSATVLVTGGSGFIASHCMVKLLKAGYTVRATVRTPSCEYVLHVASPFPVSIDLSIKDDDLIIPAREGTLRVLRAAKEHKVKRVVITSSAAAIAYGHEPTSKPFDETSWSNLNSKALHAYERSKTIAERAAWDFIREPENDGLELCVVNPTVVFGPALGPDVSTLSIFVQLMSGKVPRCPKICFTGLVDVRDLADLHLTCMTHPAAKGQRFIAAAGDAVSMLQLSDLIRPNVDPKYQAKLPTGEIPTWVLWLIGFFSPTIAHIVPALGAKRCVTHAKASTLLGWQPRSNEECVAATVASVVELGLV